MAFHLAYSLPGLCLQLLRAKFMLCCVLKSGESESESGFQHKFSWLSLFMSYMLYLNPGNAQSNTFSSLFLLPFTAFLYVWQAPSSLIVGLFSSWRAFPLHKRLIRAVAAAGPVWAVSGQEAPLDYYYICCNSDAIMYLIWHLLHVLALGWHTHTHISRLRRRKSQSTAIVCAQLAHGRQGRGLGKRGPSTPHCGPLHTRVRSARGIRGQPSCGLSWLPLSIFAVGKTLFASFVDFVRRRSNLPPAPPPQPIPRIFFFTGATGFFLQRLLQLQATHFNLFLCGCLCCFCCAFECISWACNNTHRKFKLRFRFAFDFAEKIGHKKHSRIDMAQLQNDAAIQIEIDAIYRQMHFRCYQLRSCLNDNT